jgi:hypothetical protein
VGRVTFELGRALLLSQTVTPDGLSRALGVTIDPGMPLARALVGLGLVGEDDLQEELSKSDSEPAVTEVTPRIDLMQLLPLGICNRLAAIPVDTDEDGTVVVAVLDPRDAYLAEEFAFQLRRKARLVRAPYTILREALVNYATTHQSSVPPPGARRQRRRRVSHTPAWGTPIDLAPVSSRAADGARPPVIASVTTSTRRFFGGMHSAPSRPPPVIPDVDDTSPDMDGQPKDPVFELRHGPNMTLTDLEPLTQRIREEPAFPLVASLPRVLPVISPETIPSFEPDPASTLGDLRVAESRDEVLALIEKSARAVAKRVALLVLRKDTLVGWSCSPAFGAPDALRDLSIATKGGGLLRAVLDGELYLGPLLGSVGTALLTVMKTSTRDVAIIAVRASKRPVVVIVCDELTDTLLATRHLEVMAKVAGEAIERIVRARRG